jgi:lipopolysaccharide transport system permease protein
MVVIRSNNNFSQSWLQTLAALPSDLKKSVYPGLQLALRDMRSSYRMNILGYTWILLPPLVTTVVWLLLGQAGLLAPTLNTKMPYAVFIVTGTVLWSLFSDALNAPREQLKQNLETLSNQVVLPEVLLVAGCGQVAVNFVVRCLMIIVVLFWTGFKPSIWCGGFFVAAAAIMLSGLTLGVIICPLASIYRDIGQAINIALPVLMFSVPVVYSVPEQGILKTIMISNPLTPAFISARESLNDKMPWDSIIALGAIACSALVAFFAGWAVLKFAVTYIIERK